jgi:hypothetical protein
MTRHLLRVLPVWPYPWRYWRAGPVKSDQGLRGACEGFACYGLEQSSPIRRLAPNSRGDFLYDQMKLIDGYPGEGTDARSAMKVLRALNSISNYVWAENPYQLDSWLTQCGPVCIGVNWREGMLIPAPDGYVSATGSIAGGHAVLIRALTIRGDYRIVNSWTHFWGLNGEAKIRRADMHKLLFDEGGDAVAPTETPLPVLP